jgi:hypothetical protein
MIRLGVVYPKTDGAKFDHDYVEIDTGLDGPYEAAVHFLVPSTDAIAAAMAAEGTGAIMADVANCTDIQPVLQTSEIAEG